MSATDEHQPGNPPIDDALVINTRLLEVERQQAEEKRRDAAYKKRQLWFNGLLVAFTAGLLIANLIYDWITLDVARTARLSADAAQNAAKVAESQLTYSERPWVRADVKLVGPVTFDDETTIQKATTFHMIVTLKNVGHSVATHVNDWEDAIPFSFGSTWDAAFARQREYCDAARMQKDRPGYLLFPDEQTPHGSVAGPSKAVLDKVRAQSKQMISFLLVGCVDYQSPLDVLHHQTRFTYMVVKPDSLFGPVMGAFKPTGKIDGLVLMQNPFGGGVSVD